MIKNNKQFSGKIKTIEILTVLALLIALGLAGHINLERAKQMNDSVDRYIVDEIRDGR